jgi:hypothetical protein
MKESERGFMQSVLRERDGRIAELERACRVLREGLAVLAMPEAYNEDTHAIPVRASLIAQNTLHRADAIANPDAPTETKP